MRKDSCEINGKRYVTTKTIVGFWDVKQSLAAKYCRDGLVPGAEKDTSGRWIIPIEAKKPLHKSAVTKVLWLVLQLKNEPAYHIDYSVLGIAPQNLRDAFTYLENIQLVKELPEALPADRLPYEAQLTTKGLEWVQDLQSARQKTGNDGKGDTIKQCLQILTELIKFTSAISA